ncbi:hypothetical protein F3J22_16660 [Chitinophaga sp. Cy-1792]|nr:hypothetical protein [Chitinophaga sp. Cy-1792]
MKTGLIMWCALCFHLQLSAQLKKGDKVTQITIRDASNKPMTLPHFGEKSLLIFYPDPDHASQNKTITNYLKAHPISSPNIFAFGVVNLKDAPLLPNSIVRMMVRREVNQTGANIYTDVNNTLSKSWHMGDVNNKFVIIFIDKTATVQFYKAGELTAEERKDLLHVIKQHS